MPLTAENKTKILTALRSGNFTQARYTIGNFNAKQLCCVGVAAVVCGIPVPTYEGHKPLTGVCAEYIGLTDTEKDEWVGWNDCELLTFTQIADLVGAKY